MLGDIKRLEREDRSYNYNAYSYLKFNSITNIKGRLIELKYDVTDRSEFLSEVFKRRGFNSNSGPLCIAVNCYFINSSQCSEFMSRHGCSHYMDGLSLPSIRVIKKVDDLPLIFISYVKSRYNFINHGIQL